MEKSFVLYGAGRFAEDVYLFIKKHLSNIRIEYVIDNDINKKYFFDLKVYNKAEIDLSKFPIIVCTGAFYDEIATQLKKSELKENEDFYNGFVLKECFDQINESEKIINKLNIANVSYKLVTEKDLLTKKTSDKLFVFGMGTSINSYSDKMWNFINKHDSWGVNFFNTHEFTPKFFSFEFINNDTNKFEKIYSNVLLRKDYPLDYIKDLSYITSHEYYYTLSNTNYVLPISKDIRLHMKDEKQYFDALHLLKELNVMGTLWKQGIYFGGVTSISSVIFHGINMGYQEIILNGVDLYNSKYFYDEDSSKTFSEVKLEFPIRKHDLNEVHEVSTGKYVLPAERYIYLINEIFAKPNGAEIFIGTRKSKLNGLIKYYDWNL